MLLQYGYLKNSLQPPEQSFPFKNTAFPIFIETLPLMNYELSCFSKF